MGASYVTDMRHFSDVVNPFGQVPDSVRRLGEYFGSIVEAATSFWYRGSDHDSAVRCRRRPARRVCPGHLRVRVSDVPEEITWRCSSCDDNGFIRGWRGSRWDFTKTRVQGERDPENWTVRIVPAAAHRIAAACFLLEDVPRRILRAAETTAEGAVLLRCPGPALPEFLTALATEASHASTSRERRAFEVLRRLLAEAAPPR